MPTTFFAVTSALSNKSDLVCVERRGQGYTGNQILRRCETRRQILADAGVRYKTSLLILVHDNLLAFETTLAAWALGACVALVDFKCPPSRLQEYVDIIKPELLIFGKGAGPNSSVKVLHLPFDLDYADQTLRAGHDLKPEDTALYITSSGTTAAPKAESRSHASYCDYIHNTQNSGVYKMLTTGSSVSPSSLAFSASMGAWVIHLCSGRSIIALELMHSLAELDSALKRPDVESTAMAPSVLRRLLAYHQPGDAEPRYPQLKRLGTVGGPLSQEDKLAAFHRLSPNFAMTYSATGCGTIAYFHGEELLDQPASVGEPVHSRAVTIVLNDKPCAVGQVGEIQVTLHNGKVRYPDDMGYLDERGYLYVTGRKAGIVCRNGVNFSSERIREAALLQPGVEEAVALSKPDAAVGDRVYLLVQGQLEPDFHQKLSQALPRTERPDAVVQVDSIPVTAGGKQDLRACRDLLEQALAMEQASV